MTGLAPDEWFALQRAGFLIGPLAVAAGLILADPPRPREMVAAMVAFLWQLPALLGLNLLAAWLGWWTFAAPRNALVGVPIDVWIGWAVWWGPGVALLHRRIPAWIIVGVSILLDLATMPRLTPLVALGPNWLVGEVGAVALCLAPALWAAWLTREDRAPKRRAMFHVLGWGGYVVLVIPVCVLTYVGKPLHDLYRLPHGPIDWTIAAVGLLFLFVGVAATAEFARVGEGTPIPFDPPKRVVTSGPYAVTANPMQIISAFFMGVLALYAHSWALAFVGAMFAIFDTVYATWYNRAHIAVAMPEAWSTYRDTVREWRLRWAPEPLGRAEVTISPDGPARVVWDRAWPTMSRHLRGDIAIVTATRSDFRRLVYRRPEAGVEDFGIKAAARLLEHGPAPLALFAWALRFPYFGGGLQRLTGLSILVWRRRVGLR